MKSVQWRRAGEAMCLPASTPLFRSFCLRAPLHCASSFQAVKLRGSGLSCFCRCGGIHRDARCFLDVHAETTANKAGKSMQSVRSCRLQRFSFSASVCSCCSCNANFHVALLYSPTLLGVQVVVTVHVAQQSSAVTPEFT